MSDVEPANDAAFKVVDAFNKSGFPFQDAVLEETGRLWSAGKSRWRFEVAEYPVSVGGRSVRIDFVLSHPSRRLFLLAECKRVLPGGGWGFARSAYVRRGIEEFLRFADQS